MIVICLFSTTFRRSSFNVTGSPSLIPSIRDFFILNFLFTFTNHCSLGSGSITPPLLSAVVIFWIIVSSFSRSFSAVSHWRIISRASFTFLPLYGSTVIRAYSSMTWTKGRSCRRAISESIWLCAGVTPTAPVPYAGSTARSGTIFIRSFVPANETSNSFPIYLL